MANLNTLNEINEQLYYINKDIKLANENIKQVDKNINTQLVNLIEGSVLSDNKRNVK